MRINFTSFAITLACSTAAGQAEPADYQQSDSFREQVGLAPVDLAAMSASPMVQDALTAAAREHLRTTTQGDSVVINAIGAAGRDLSATLSWGRDSASDYAELQAASSEALEALAPLTEQLRSLLPTNLRRYLTRAVANAGLDSPYRLLDLTAAQRQQLLALQRQRDAVLLDARQRERPERLQAARQAFETAVAQILTAEQGAELAQFQANIAANLETVLDRELEEDPNGEDTTDSPIARAKQGVGDRQDACPTTVLDREIDGDAPAEDATARGGRHESGYPLVVQASRLHSAAETAAPQFYPLR